MSNAGTSTLSFGEAIERLEGKWASITDFGVLLAALGVAAIAFSLIATITAVTLNGVLFLISGVAEVAIGMHARAWGPFFFWVIGGVLYLAAGLICIVNPVLASVVPTLLLGAGLIAAGAVRLLLAFRLPPLHPRLMVFVTAAVTILLGPVICQPLADGQRLRVGNAARRRSAVPRRRLGELRVGTARAGLSLVAPALI